MNLFIWHLLATMFQFMMEHYANSKHVTTYQNCFLLAVESNSQFMEFKFVRNTGLFQNKSVNLKKYFRDCVIIIMRGAEKQEGAPYKLRGEEQNREEAEMAQKKIGRRKK